MTTLCPKCKAKNPDTKQFCGDYGTQLTPAKEGPISTQTLEVPIEELATGSTFAGRYQIIEQLGRGGMAILYFDNVFGDENLDYWREGIAELIITNLIAARKRT